MEDNGSPSQTALTAAAARAAHLIVDHQPWIFADHLAAVLLGRQADEFIGYHRAHGEHLVLSAARAQVTCRSRFTEGPPRGRGPRVAITQYVILGAGLDSFAYRSPAGREGPVFEVDHPATQEWKRRSWRRPGSPVPDGVSFVPADFEHLVLAGQPAARPGSHPSRPALVSWLGVTMYLTRTALGQALAEIGGFAPGTELVTDYMLPAGLRDPDGESYASWSRRGRAARRALAHLPGPR